MRRGKSSPPSDCRRLFADKYSRRTYTMHSDEEGDLTDLIAIVRQYSRRSRSRHKLIAPRTLVDAVVGQRLRAQTPQPSVTQICALYLRG